MAARVRTFKRDLNRGGRGILEKRQHEVTKKKKGLRRRKGVEERRRKKLAKLPRIEYETSSGKN